MTKSGFTQVFIILVLIYIYKSLLQIW